MKHTMGYTAAVIAVLLMTGCMQGGSGGAGAEPTTAESYQYKGRKDPFLATPAADRAEAMAERFKLIQGRV